MKKNIKKIIVVAISSLVLITGLISSKIFINKKFIEKYPSTFNQEYRLVLLSLFNFYEPYIVHYNYGNYYYKEGRYNEAIEKYKKALTYNVPKYRICDIELNLSLSIMKMVNSVSDDEAIELLKEAKNHLYTCANMDLEDVIEEEKQRIEKNTQERENEAEKKAEEKSSVDGISEQAGKSNSQTIDEAQENNQGDGDGTDETKATQLTEPGDAKEGVKSSDGKGTESESKNPGSNPKDGNSTGDSDDGTGGKDIGVGSGAGGKDSENEDGINNGEGKSSSGKKATGGGEGEIDGDNKTSGKSNLSSADVNNGGSGTGTGDKANEGSGTGGNGTAGIFGEKTTEEKQKEAKEMGIEISKEINNLLQKLNEQKEIEDTVSKLEIDKKVNALRESNQKAMNLKEISLQEMARSKAQASGKSHSGKSVKGADPGESESGSSSSVNVGEVIDRSAGSYGSDDSASSQPQVGVDPRLR